MNNAEIFQYVVEEEEIAITAHIYGMGGSTTIPTRAMLIYRNFNPCFDHVIMGPELAGLVGPMYNGNKMKASDGVEYKVFDRYESVELNARLAN